jgi:hemolysin activation/secretion protein
MRTTLILILLAALPGSAIAQFGELPRAPGQSSPAAALPSVVAPLTPPVIIERMTPPAAPQLAPSIRPAVPEPARGPGEQVRVRVESARLTGNTSISEASLLPVLQPLVGREVELREIEQARVDIISLYGQRGYPFVTASAVVTPSAGGVDLAMTITEGRIASVKIDENSNIGPAGTQVLRFLDRLVDGETLTTRALERALLLAGDVPGVKVVSVIRPLQNGQQGELELVVQLTRQAFSGYFTVDNRGPRFAGPVEWLLVAGANSFTSLGERTELTLFQAQDREQTFGQFASNFFVGGSGLNVRVYAGSGITRPGSPLNAVGYRGYVNVFGLGASYPIIRSRPFNVFATAQFDYLNSAIDLGQNSQRSNLDEVRALRFGLEGSALDTILGFAPAPAVGNANLRLHQGVLWLGGGGGGPNGAARVGSDFTFSKLTGELGRVQPLIALNDAVTFGVQGVVAGQWSRDVLPVAEKFYLGGNRLGRGFFIGQITGDSAVGLSGELQLNVRMPAFNITGSGAKPFEMQPSAQFYMFRDYGVAWQNLPTDPTLLLSSFGGGVRLALTENLLVDLEGVHRITRQPDGTFVKPLPASAFFFRVLARY